MGGAWVVRLGGVFVMTQLGGHHAEDEVQTDGAQRGKTANVAEPELARLSVISVRRNCPVRGFETDVPAAEKCQTERRTTPVLPGPRRP